VIVMMMIQGSTVKLFEGIVPLGLLLDRLAGQFPLSFGGPQDVNVDNEKQIRGSSDFLLPLDLHRGKFHD
jgi:hypothetical protein